MGELSRTSRRKMDELIGGLSAKPEQLSKSEKIRQLADAGYEKADIARYLNVRYQFVYNVLSAPRPANDRRKQSVAPQVSDPDPRMGEDKTERRSRSPKWIWATVGKGGRVELPPFFLEALELQEGDAVQLGLEGDAVRIVSRAVALRELQADVRRCVPEGVSLVDELIAERRAEAAKETESASND